MSFAATVSAPRVIDNPELRRRVALMDQNSHFLDIVYDSLTVPAGKERFRGGVWDGYVTTEDMIGYAKSYERIYPPAYVGFYGRVLCLEASYRDQRTQECMTMSVTVPQYKYTPSQSAVVWLSEHKQPIDFVFYRVFDASTTKGFYAPTDDHTITHTAYSYGISVRRLKHVEADSAVYFYRDAEDGGLKYDIEDR